MIKNKHLFPKTAATTFDVEPTHAVLTAFASVNRDMKAMRCMNVDRSLEVCCQHQISHVDVSWACHLFSSQILVKTYAVVLMHIALMGIVVVTRVIRVTRTLSVVSLLKVCTY